MLGTSSAVSQQLLIKVVQLSNAYSKTIHSDWETLSLHNNFLLSWELLYVGNIALIAECVIDIENKFKVWKQGLE